MKNRLAIFALSGSCLFFSCKKDNNENQSSASMAKTYTEDIRISGPGSSFTTFNLTYDANQRLVSMVSTPLPSVLEFRFDYEPNNSFTQDLYNNQTLGIHEIAWLNSSSLLDSTFQFNNEQDSSTEKYLYNANGQLTQMKRYDYSVSGSTLKETTDYTYDNNGNLSLEVKNGTSSIGYEYYTDLPNVYPMGKSFFTQPKNMVKTATRTSGGISNSSTHYYTFDGSHRLMKDSITTTNSSVIAIKSYTY